jgi:ribosomal protein L16 Arg81 hydroxylase
MAKLDFSYLVAPFTAADFFDHYWQKAALVMERDETDRYRGQQAVSPAPLAIRTFH